MKRIFTFILLSFLVFFLSNTFAKPGFIIVPFAKSINLAPNTDTDVLIVAQNNTTVNQTVTNIKPMIPIGSGITGTVKATNCKFLSPGTMCQALITLHSSNARSIGDLNVSVCSFNGTFCSRIVNPLRFANGQPVALYIAPNNKVIATSTTQQFYAVGVFSNGSIQNVTSEVSWKSSKTVNATISNQSGTVGLATGVNAGTSTISASYGPLSASTILAVTPATLKSITITPINPRIVKGTTQQFIATGIFTDDTSQDITSLATWSSSNTTNAAISNKQGEKGLAQAKSAGPTIIKATYLGMSGSTTLTVTAPILKAISVSPAYVRTALLTTQRFHATGIYSDNSTQDLTSLVTWSTGSIAIAVTPNLTKNTKGYALGTGLGTTKIIASLGNVSGAANINVIKATLTKIDLVPISATITVGMDRAYQAIGTYSNHLRQDLTTQVTWHSSNINNATVSNAPGSQGVATGINQGNVIISASLDGIVGRGDLKITSPDLISIKVTPDGSTIPNGTQQQFIAIGTYSDGSTQDLTTAATWESSDTSIAGISSATGTKGLAQAISPGPTTISATYNGIPGSTLLTVSAETLKSITITPANSSIPINDSVQLIATGTYSNATTKNITQEVTWSSSQTSIASISNAILTKGQASGLSVGTTTIKAVSNGITGSTTLTVVNNSQNCYVSRRSDSSSYWLGYDIYTDSAPLTLDFSATGIDLKQIIVYSGVFSDVQVIDNNHLHIGTKPDWVSTLNPGFIDFYGLDYGPYEPFNTPIVATCQTN